MADEKMLATVEEEAAKALQVAVNVINKTPLLSRVQTVKEKPLKVIDDEKMNYITEKVGELNEKVYNFSKKDSQTTKKLMSLTMLFPADSTYRVLQQITAQIERKQQAITENTIKMKKTQAKISKLKKKLESAETEEDKAILQLDIQQKQIELANSMSYIEAAIKELGALIETYEQIKKNKNIPDDWDEYDFEREEIKTNIKNAFRNGLRDMIVHGRLGMGTCEYFEQFGISPLAAAREISAYINSHPDGDTYKEMYGWLNRMANKYAEAYKDACENIGLDPDNLISYKYVLMSQRNKENILALENKKEEESDE